jgi:hypothetical protein
VALQGRGERVVLCVMHRHTRMGRAHGRSTGERVCARVED